MKKKKNTSRKKRKQDGFLIILILSLIFLFLASVLIVLVRDPVTFAISLDKQNITRGESLNLNYGVSNSGFYKMQNVSMKVEIQDIFSSINTTDYEDPVGFLDKINGQHTFPTYSLSTGNYTVEANLTYILNGKPDSKSLTLGFGVIS